jgi:hypothetical protein
VICVASKFETFLVEGLAIVGALTIIGWLEKKASSLKTAK